VNSINVWRFINEYNEVVYTSVGLFERKGREMHPIRHWTLRYLWNRFNDKRYRSQHPDDPWLAPEAIHFLETYLRPTDTGLEFGSGRSTIWFAKRIQSLTSVEHNPEWHARVSKGLKDLNISNVSYHLHQKSNEDRSGTNSEYVGITKSITPASLNFVLVDGIYRAQCVLQCIPLLLPGGILIIDNVNKYLPSDSIAPNSRSIAEGPIDAEWENVLELIQTWRSYWTGNGVSDTAVYFKP